jgi:hypothetical protein
VEEKNTTVLPETATLHCDASRRAWGGVLNNQCPARGTWRPHQAGEHITSLELRAVLYTVETFLDRLRGRHVRLWEDNRAVVAMLASWTSRHPLLRQPRPLAPGRLSPHLWVTPMPSLSSLTHRLRSW